MTYFITFTFGMRDSRPTLSESSVPSTEQSVNCFGANSKHGADLFHIQYVRVLIKNDTVYLVRTHVHGYYPPSYIMVARNWQTPYPLAKGFFDEISAPYKVFFSVPNAGHVTTLDNKEEFTRILVEEIRPLFA